MRWSRLLGALILLGSMAAAQHRHPAPAERGAAAAPLFDNLGTHHHPVTTSSEQAQKYFNQGLRLFYAFNLEEAERSFREAARLDPRCAMAYWGIALSLGPSINMPMPPALEGEAHQALQAGLAAAARVSEREKAYLQALSHRYSRAGGPDRGGRDAAYADAMRKLWQRYPDDLDAGALLADAILNLRPWDQWTPEGRPQPGTLELLAVLEQVLDKNPRHPGANHYYIHALEASPHPERALEAAERIADLMPGAGHLVHMPSHIYLRLGRYADAVESSRRGAAVDKEYILKFRPRGNYPLMFYSHNIYFEWAALCMEGRSREALRSARALVDNFPDELVRRIPMLEFFRPAPLLTLVRFGQWEEVLREGRPPADLIYLSGIWHYARGIALTALGRRSEAAQEKERLSALASTLAARMPVEGNSPAALLRLAEAVLAGETAAGAGNWAEAVKELQEAVSLQDRLRYDEPPAWYYPVRQSQGAVLLAAGRPDQAEAVYRRDLERNPDNGWSLYGLVLSLRAQGKEEAAGAAEQRFLKAWARADVRLPASRFGP